MVADDMYFYYIAAENADPTFTRKFPDDMNEMVDNNGEASSVAPEELQAMQERAERVRERVELGRSRSSEQIGSVIPFEEIDE